MRNKVVKFYRKEARKMFPTSPYAQYERAVKYDNTQPYRVDTTQVLSMCVKGYVQGMKNIHKAK